MPDLTITPANVLVTSTGGARGDGIAGAAITAGQALYRDAIDGRLKLAQADATAAEAAAVGIALHSAEVGQPVEYAGHGAKLNIGATTVKTTTYVVSVTAGGIAPQADLIATNRITRLGYATDAAGAFIVDIAHTGATV